MRPDLTRPEAAANDAASLGADVFTRFEESCRDVVDWLGATTSKRFFDRDLELVKLGRPPVDREIFEWESLLEAVMDARDEFVGVELGAGYGRWTVNAARAADAHSGIPYRLVAVEAEPTHFSWLKEHVRANGLSRRRVRLLHAAVSDHDGTTELYGGDPESWYGQALVDVAGAGLDHPVLEVKAVRLPKLIERFERVDLVHLDVQGVELRVLRDSVAALGKVRRVHVETHSAEIEAGLREVFSAAGWQPMVDYECGTTSETPWGVIEFAGGGVQAWMNTGWKAL